jgi:hypothetical protein
MTSDSDSSDSRIRIGFVQYHRSIADELKATQDRLRNLTGGSHWLSVCENTESLLRKTLRDRLPESLRVSRGLACRRDGPFSQLDALITYGCTGRIFSSVHDPLRSPIQTGEIMTLRG